MIKLNLLPFARIQMVLCFLLFNLVLNAQTESFLYGDALPDAPELTARGTYKIGVRTLDFVHKGQADVLNSKNGIDPIYNRPLKVEVWYPAQLANRVEESVIYEEVMGTANDTLRPLTPFTFKGRASRNAAPLTTDGAFPLLVVAHGYVGSRYLMTYLTENLASKGYVVVAIDHTDSTFKDASPFQSTLVNRAKDISFILNQVANLGKAKDKNFLSGLVDSDNIGIIGYSMGGYGVLNVAGAGYSDGLVGFFASMAGGSKAITELAMSNPAYAKVDPRIKAVVAFAPWGMERGIWDAEGLKGLKIPTFFVAGSQDDISGYEKGIKAIYTGAVSADRYLLTYKNARHNVAPNPPPVESLKPGLHIDEYYRYAEPSWDERKINNVNQHFLTAFLGIHLKQQKEYSKFLEIQENSNEKDWTGFKPRSSTGMELLHATPTP